MSVFVTIACDRDVGQFGRCTAQVRIWDATSLDHAWVVASQIGWSQRRDGTVDCPPHGRNLNRSPSLVSARDFPAR